MNEITFNVGTDEVLCLNYQGENNWTNVYFSGFERTDEDNAVYFMIDDPIGKMILLDLDYGFTATYPILQEAYSTAGQLVEMNSDLSFIRKSEKFRVEVLSAINLEEEVEYSTSETELLYAQIYELYNLLQGVGDGTVTIRANGTTYGTFNVNQSEDSTIDMTIHAVLG